MWQIESGVQESRWTLSFRPNAIRTEKLNENIPSSDGRHIPASKMTFSASVHDDILFFSKNTNNPMAHLRQVLTLLRDAAATLKLKERSFLAKKISYLQQVIWPGRLEISEAINAAVRELK